MKNVWAKDTTTNTSTLTTFINLVFVASIGRGCPIHWTGLLDWTTGLDYWTGLLDWTTGLDYWTGLLD